MPDFSDAATLSIQSLSTASRDVFGGGVGTATRLEDDPEREGRAASGKRIPDTIEAAAFVDKGNACTDNEADVVEAAAAEGRAGFGGGGGGFGNAFQDLPDFSSAAALTMHSLSTAGGDVFGGGGGNATKLGDDPDCEGIAAPRKTIPLSLIHI